FIVGGPVGDFELLLCHGTVCVVGKMRDLILQLSKSSIYSTKPHITTSHVSSQIKDHFSFVKYRILGINQYILWGFAFVFECHILYLHTVIVIRQICRDLVQV
ncbi:hypothetical protein ACO1ZE_27355, partial [Klebsiella pneumoniae subsp. pneumoniae]